ncbi:MAG: hypothetical protein ABSG23_00645 [Terriglobales bacterium]|jgi:hypothetical protein
MLDPESEQIREVCARFGLAVYSAQCLERELAMLLAASGTPEYFTAWDYDDRLAGNFDSTFGALVTMFAGTAGPTDKQLLIELEKAVRDRNELVHGYFWNRSVEFASTEGRTQMLEELDHLVRSFDSLDAKVSVLVNDLMKKRGVTEDVVQAQFEKLMSGIAAPHDPKKLQKSVVITAASEWKVGEAVKCGILFVSDAGNLVLGERGLCLGPQAIPTEHLKVKPEFAKALPATVNPKPKKADRWNYVIPLAKGYDLRVRPTEMNGRRVIRFGLQRRTSKAKS